MNALLRKVEITRLLEELLHLALSDAECGALTDFASAERQLAKGTEHQEQYEDLYANHAGHLRSLAMKRINKEKELVAAIDKYRNERYHAIKDAGFSNSKICKVPSVIENKYVSGEKK